MWLFILWKNKPVFRWFLSWTRTSLFVLPEGELCDGLNSYVLKCLRLFSSNITTLCCFVRWGSLLHRIAPPDCQSKCVDVLVRKNRAFFLTGFSSPLPLVFFRFTLSVWSLFFFAPLSLFHFCCWKLFHFHLVVMKFILRLVHSCHETPALRLTKTRCLHLAGWYLMNILCDTTHWKKVINISWF